MGNELIDYVKHMINKGNARQLVIKNPTGKQVMEVPLSVGVGIGAVLLIFAPTLIAIAAVAALLAEYKVELPHKEDVGE